MAAPDIPSPTGALPPRRRRIALATVLVALALLAYGLHWVSRPDRVARLILTHVGNALGLEITATGASEYRLRGTPMLAIRDVVARQPGAKTPVLRAQRIQLELPWATIRALGADLTVRRLELDAPELDLVALQRWLATRPPTKETRIPTLTDGLSIVRGRVIGDGWLVEAIDADLPSLHPNRAARTHLRGRLATRDIRVPFDVHVALTRPAARAGLGVVGQVTVQSPPWTMPMRARLSGRLHNGDDGIGLDGMRMGADAAYRNAGTDIGFTYGLAGPARIIGGELRVRPLGAVVYGTGVVPSFQAAGALSFGDALTLRLGGTMSSWPRAWPALPAPLISSTSPLPFTLDYHGRADLSDTTALRLQRDQTRFDARFRLPAFLRWLDFVDRGTPLPPLDGRLTTPRLEIGGATLEGVEVDFSEDAPPTNTR